MQFVQAGRLRQIPFHGPLIVVWVQFIPMLLRLPWDAKHRKWSAALWLATLTLLPLLHWRAHQLFEWISNDRMSSAFFCFTGMFALEEMRIMGWAHPARVIVLAVLAAIEFWGCAGILLDWPGFEPNNPDVDGSPRDLF